MNPDPTTVEPDDGRGGEGRWAPDGGSTSPTTPTSSPHYVRFSGARLAIMAALVAIAAIRFALNPPLPRVIWILLPGWFFVAAVYHLLQPRQQMPYWFVYMLRVSFFVYEISVILMATHFLGGSGWLAILFLLLPALELNLAFPDLGGSAASTLAAFGIAAVAYGEARGWLWHDPFFTVGAPLYREPAYVGAVLALAIVFLVILPGWLGRYRRSATPTRS